MTPESDAQRICVVVTHKIRPGSDKEFLDALLRLHEARRSAGLVTERWLVMRDRDREDTYTQILEYANEEAETRANQSPELGALRQEIGAVSAGRPEHVWMSVVLSS